MFVCVLSPWSTLFVGCFFCPHNLMTSQSPTFTFSFQGGHIAPRTVGQKKPKLATNNKHAHTASAQPTANTRPLLGTHFRGQAYRYCNILSLPTFNNKVRPPPEWCLAWAAFATQKKSMHTRLARHLESPRVPLTLAACAHSGGGIPCATLVDLAWHFGEVGTCHALELSKWSQ